MRTIGPVRAGLASLLVLGLGYVYVGRIKLAIAVVLGAVGLIAVAGWTRLVFDPLAVYVLAAVAGLVVILVIVHSVLIALRNREAPSQWYNRWWFYVLWVLATLLASEVLVSSRPILFGFEPLRVPSSSMAPLLQRGDFIMADTWHFRNAEPQYGDLIVFRVPSAPSVKYLKRVVGLPGDMIEIRGDVLTRNGLEIEEPYIQLTDRGPAGSVDFGPEEVPEDSYFVLGDNRHRAKDSRYIGSIDRRFLHGLVVHRWFAFGESVRWERFPERLAVQGE